MFLTDAKVVLNKQVAKNTYLLFLDAQKIPSEARPGQFIMLKPYPAEIGFLRRPFSICLSFPEKSIFGVLYIIRGKITQYMSSLEKGARVSVIGPLGNAFKVPEDTLNLILLGGGIGIAPLISFLPVYEKRVHFIAGFRSSDECVDIRKIFPGTYSYIVATEDGSKGYKGTCIDLFTRYTKDRVLTNTAVISCGPPAMLKALSKICSQIKVPCYVFLETYMACGVGLCQGCSVKTKHGYKRVCKDGPLFKAEEICWEEIQD